MDENLGKNPVFDKMEYNAGFRADYEKILRSFGYDEARDARGRDELIKNLTSTNWRVVVEELETRIKDKWVVVAGSGPAGPVELNWVLQAGFERIISNCAFVAADGAARYLIKQAVTPTAVFSDLDGITPEIMGDLNRKNTVFVIHAHGDNLEAIEAFKSKIRRLKLVIGTTQTQPKPPTINPGGFTDGDRILYFLSHLPPTFKILLIGMDFGSVVGQYSKPALSSDVPATPIKVKKLAIAVELLSKLLPTMPQPIYGLERVYPFPGVRKLSRAEFEQSLQVDEAGGS